MDLNGYRDWVYRAMKSKGFHDGRQDRGRDDTLVRLALVHTEVSEATQVVKRHGLDDDGRRAEFAEEVADALIRLFDLCGCVGVDVDAAVRGKMHKNLARPQKYGTPEEGK